VARDELNDFWPTAPGAKYDLAVYGPDGYFVHQSGAADPDSPVIMASPGAARTMQLTISNPSSAALHIEVNETYSSLNHLIEVHQQDELTILLQLQGSQGWYELTVKTPSNDRGSTFRQFAGRLEDDRPSVSDPLLMTTATRPTHAPQDTGG
jgi:phospholipase C